MVTDLRVLPEPLRSLGMLMQDAAKCGAVVKWSGVVLDKDLDHLQGVEPGARALEAAENFPRGIAYYRRSDHNGSYIPTHSIVWVR